MKFDDTLKRFVKLDLKANLIPMLIGEPGIGKSSWVEDLAQELHTKAFTLACNQLADKSDLTGQRLVPHKYTDSKGQERTTYVQVFYPHVVIQKAMEYAKKHPDETPILFLDELNRTTPDVTSEALSIPTMRSIGDRPLPSNLKVITAGNDKGNVSSLDKASISRFVLYHVKPDVDTFLDLDQNLNPYIKKDLELHPEDIFELEKPHVAKGDDPDDDDDDDGDDDGVDPNQLETILGDEDLRQLTTPRTISGLSRWLNLLSQSDLKELDQTQDPDPSNAHNNLSLLFSGIIAHVGDTVFASNLNKLIDTSLQTPIVNPNQASSITTIKKPLRFDDLLNAKSITELDKVANDLTPELAQNNLIYALYDGHKNDQIISSLFKVIKRFDKAHVKRLVVLIGSNSLNDYNMQCAENNTSTSAKQISALFDLIN